MYRSQYYSCHLPEYCCHKGIFCSGCNLDIVKLSGAQSLLKNGIVYMYLWTWHNCFLLTEPDSLASACYMFYPLFSFLTHHVIPIAQALNTIDLNKGTGVRAFCLDFLSVSPSARMLTQKCDALTVTHTFARGLWILLIVMFGHHRWSAWLV